MSSSVSAFTQSILGTINRNQDSISKSAEDLSTNICIHLASDSVVASVLGQQNKTNMVVAEAVSANLSDLSLMLALTDRTANDAMSSLRDIRALVTQATSSTLNPQTLAGYGSQINTILDGLDNIAKSVQYNGVTLFNGGFLSNVPLSDPDVAVNSVDYALTTGAAAPSFKNLNNKHTETLTFVTGAGSLPSTTETFTLYEPNGQSNVVFTFKSSGTYNASTPTDIEIGTTGEITAQNVLERIKAYQPDSPTLQRLDFSLDSTSLILTVSSLAPGETSNVLISESATNVTRADDTSYAYQEINTLTTLFADADTVDVYDPTDSTGARKITFTGTTTAANVTAGSKNFFVETTLGTAALNKTACVANLVSAIRNYSGADAYYLSGLQFSVSPYTTDPAIQITALGYAASGSSYVTPAQATGGSTIASKALINIAGGTGRLNSGGAAVAAPAGILTGGASTTKVDTLSTTTGYGVNVDTAAFTMTHTTFLPNFSAGVSVQFATLTSAAAGVNLTNDATISAANAFGISELSSLATTAGAYKNNTSAQGTAMIDGVEYDVFVFVPALIGGTAPVAGCVGSHTPIYFKEHLNPSNWFKMNLAGNTGITIANTSSVASLSNVITMQGSSFKAYSEQAIPVDQSGGIVAVNGLKIADMSDFSARWKGQSGHMLDVFANSFSITQDESNSINFLLKMSDGSVYTLNAGTIAANTSYDTSENQLYPGRKLVLSNLDDSNQKITLQIGDTAWDVSTEDNRVGLASAVLFALGGAHTSSVQSSVGGQSIGVSLPNLTKAALLGDNVIDVTTIEKATRSQRIIDDILTSVSDSLQTVATNERLTSMQKSSLEGQMVFMQKQDESLFVTNIVSAAQALEDSMGRISAAIQTMIQKNNMDRTLRNMVINAISSQ